MTFDDYCKATGHYAENGDRAMWEAATKAEREACAKVCDSVGDGPENGCCPTFWNDALEAVQTAIRKRSNAGGNSPPRGEN